MCGKAVFFCPHTSFIHLAIAMLLFFPSFLYITVTGPKGGSTITGQIRVTYLLAIDPDKYGGIC